MRRRKRNRRTRRPEQPLVLDLSIEEIVEQLDGGATKWVVDSKNPEPA